MQYTSIVFITFFNNSLEVSLKKILIIFFSNYLNSIARSTINNEKTAASTNNSKNKDTKESIESAITIEDVEDKVDRTSKFLFNQSFLIVF